jgi:hypothetical protein
MTNKYNFLKSQTNLNIYKSTFIQQIFIGKNYKTSKHINKLHILHKNAKKLTF